MDGLKEERQTIPGGIVTDRLHALIQEQDRASLASYFTCGLLDNGEIWTNLIKCRGHHFDLKPDSEKRSDCCWLQE